MNKIFIAAIMVTTAGCGAKIANIHSSVGNAAIDLKTDGSTRPEFVAGAMNTATPTPSIQPSRRPVNILPDAPLAGVTGDTVDPTPTPKPTASTATPKPVVTPTPNVIADIGEEYIRWTHNGQEGINFTKDDLNTIHADTPNSVFTYQATSTVNTYKFTAVTGSQYAMIFTLYLGKPTQFWTIPAPDPDGYQPGPTNYGLKTRFVLYKGDVPVSGGATDPNTGGLKYKVDSFDDKGYFKGEVKYIGKWFVDMPEGTDRDTLPDEDIRIQINVRFPEN